MRCVNLQGTYKQKEAKQEVYNSSYILVYID